MWDAGDRSPGLITVPDDQSTASWGLRRASPALESNGKRTQQTSYNNPGPNRITKNGGAISFPNKPGREQSVQIRRQTRLDYSRSTVQFARGIKVGGRHARRRGWLTRESSKGGKLIRSDSRAFCVRVRTWSSMQGMSCSSSCDYDERRLALIMSLVVASTVSRSGYADSRQACCRSFKVGWLTQSLTGGRGPGG